MERKVVAVIQCRMNSERLPGKVMKTLGDRPVLAWICDKLSAAPWIDTVVIATTETQRDDQIAVFGESRGLRVVRGSEDDVLSRFAKATEGFASGTIVMRLTADNPFVDVALMKKCLELLRSKEFDYVAPDGAAVGAGAEVFTVDALRAANLAAREPSHREHVTPFLKTNPNRFKVGWVEVRPEFSSYRLTVDTPEDMAVATRIAAGLGSEALAASQEMIVTYLDSHPEIRSLNGEIKQRGF